MGSAGPVTVSVEKDIAWLELDDGKANALGPVVLEALHEALNRVEDSAKAIVLTGREGVFSGGFDLSVVSRGADAARGMAGSGARLALRLFESGRPVVAACTGHAIAMGALLLLASDTRIGVEGAFRLGLNETLMTEHV